MVATRSTPLTHKRVLTIALPIVLSNATVPILGAVDTGVVGQMGLAAPIGAVGIGAIILTAIYWVFGFLRMGTTGLTAQAIGADDHGEVSAMLTRAMIIGIGAGLVFVVLQAPLFWLAFKAAPASPEVENLARQYLHIRIFSAPAAIALFGITGWLIAKEQTRSVLVLQLWMNGLNILLDLLFVLQFDWGVQGVAFATFIAEWSGLALGLWLARAGFSGGYWRDKARVFDHVKMARMASVNGDIMIRSILLEIAFVSFLFLGSSFDDVTLAANQVLLQFLNITAYALDGFAFSAEALVGNALGARNRTRLRRAVYLTSIWGVLICIVLSIAFWFGGGFLIALMAKSEPVQMAAQHYLPWMVIAPMIGVGAWMLDGVFIGATRTADMRNMMLISFAFYVVSILILLPAYGNHGLWASLMILNIVRTITLAWKYPALEASADTA
ncbi:MATE family efflux transporter [Amylibacter kogurei]|uniref:MATE family efflux transporter n=1 Tax=Paramylibacter kogurei TaxID=1889778 RepID=A0A2G5K9R4_9RHOB|nr:MATE family efflux transporter [Amylibacter kogurei]PIB25899.1 MATE family efflux transporter [Amylibacter kogurei]